MNVLEINKELVGLELPERKVKEFEVYRLAPLQEPDEGDRTPFTLVLVARFEGGGEIKVTKRILIKLV